MNKIWSDEAWADYLYWQTQDKKTLRRINTLIKDIERNGPMNGIGEPEALKENLQGFFSRRINEKDRLVYRMHTSTMRRRYSAIWTARDAPRGSSSFSRKGSRSAAVLFMQSTMFSPLMREASAFGFSPEPPQVLQGAWQTWDIM